MRLDDLGPLLSPQGERAMGEAGALLAEGVAAHTAVERLRRRYGPQLARAAMEQAVLRRRARAKFSFADSLLLTRQGLEQASAEAVARHRARRFAGRPLILDICCGIGGDSLALAAQAPTLALDLNPLHAALCALNGRHLGLAHPLRAAAADAHHLPLRPPPLAGLFFDPARRRDGRRIHSVARYRPPLALVKGWLAHTPYVCAKVSPAVAWDEIQGLNCEVEFVSLGGELREACLWLGAFKGPERRATVLPADESLAADAEPEIPVGQIAEYLYLPDPAVMRARLVRNLAARIGAWMLDPRLAFLAADQSRATPFARRFRVLEAIPFGLKALRRALRARRVGRLTLIARGMGVDVQDLTRRLRLGGELEATVILTRVQGRPLALLVEPEEGG